MNYHRFDDPKQHAFDPDNLYIDHRKDRVGFGVGTSPSARVHITGGQATAGLAGFKLDEGTLLTTPETGALEHAGGALYFSTSDGVRHEISFADDAEDMEAIRDHFGTEFLLDTDSVRWTYNDVDDELEADVDEEWFQDTVGLMLQTTPSVVLQYDDVNGLFNASVDEEWLAATATAGEGTPGAIPKWADETTLGDSLITEAGTRITIDGDEHVTGWLGVGRAISGSATMEVVADRPSATMFAKFVNTGTANTANVVRHQFNLMTDDGAAGRERSAFWLDVSFPVIADASRDSQVDFWTTQSGSVTKVLSLQQDKVAIGDGITAEQMLHVEAATGGRVLVRSTGDDSAQILLDANRTNENELLGGIAGYWNGNLVGGIKINAGPDTGTKDSGKIQLVVADTGGGLVEGFLLEQDLGWKLWGHGIIGATTASANARNTLIINNAFSGDGALASLNVQGDLTITGVAGGTTNQGMWMGPRFDVTNAAAVYAITTLTMAPPDITVSDGSLDYGATVRITNAPTEGSIDNYSIWVDAGKSRFDGKVYIGPAPTGGVADIYGDDLVIDSTGQAGMTILSGASNSSWIYMGDASGVKEGYIQYTSSTVTMNVGTNVADGVLILRAGTQNSVLTGYANTSARLHGRVGINAEPDDDAYLFVQEGASGTSFSAAASQIVIDTTEALGGMTINNLDDGWSAYQMGSVSDNQAAQVRWSYGTGRVLQVTTRNSLGRVDIMTADNVSALYIDENQKSWFKGRVGVGMDPGTYPRQLQVATEIVIDGPQPTLFLMENDTVDTNWKALTAGGNFYVQAVNDDFAVLATALRSTVAGYVSIASSSAPSYPLDVWGSARVQGACIVTSSTPSLFLLETDTVDESWNLVVNGGDFFLQAIQDGGGLNATAMRATQDGSVSIGGGSSPSYTLDVFGDAHVLTDLTVDGVIYGAMVFNTLGVGTSTVPHAGVGVGIVAIDGPSGDAAGPHMQFTVADDDYPVMTAFNWGHDNTGFVFDAYYTGAAWKSSSASGNWRLRKDGSLLRIFNDSGVSKGGDVTWDNVLDLDSSGYMHLAAGRIKGGANGAVGRLFLNPQDQTGANTSDVHFFSDNSTSAQAGAYNAAVNIWGGSGQTRRLQLYQEVSGESYIHNTFSEIHITTVDRDILLTPGTGNIGIGVDTPDGKLHVRSGIAGAASPSAGNDELVLENDGDVGMSFMCPTGYTSTIQFMNSVDATSARIKWNDTSKVLDIATQTAGGALIQFYAGNAAPIATMYGSQVAIDDQLGSDDGFNKFVVDGANASNADGPHTAWRTAGGDPILQINANQHDKVAILFDAHKTSTWKSSDAGSNYIIYKTGDRLYFGHAYGVAVGDAPSWSYRMIYKASNGFFGFGGEANPTEQIHLGSGSLLVDDGDITTSDGDIVAGSGTIYTPMYDLGTLAAGATANTADLDDGQRFFGVVNTTSTRRVFLDNHKNGATVTVTIVFIGTTPGSADFGFSCDVSEVIRWPDAGLDLSYMDSGEFLVVGFICCEYAGVNTWLACPSYGFN
jgi:hypothetical protein